MNVKLMLPKGEDGQFDTFLQKGGLCYVISESEHNVCLHAGQSTGIIPPSITSCGNSMSAENIERREYRNPPIVEKVCQFVLTPDTPWDITVPGQIYDRVKNEFKTKEKGVFQWLKIGRPPQAPPQGAPGFETIEAVRFVSDDRKKLIQVAPRNLAINCLKPCPSWEEFKPMIENACDILTDTTQIQRFQTIKLIYVNRIEIPISSSAKITGIDRVP